MRVFLTGGTGLLGSHLAAELTRTGHEVVAMQRPGSHVDFLTTEGCEVVEGDVRDDPSRIAERMVGCSHLVHGAALVYADGSWEEIEAVNVRGTRNVLTAAADARIGHAVHVSSVAVYGTVRDPVHEDSPVDTPIPPDDLYARSKREAELAAREIEEARGLPVTVLRPSAVYGERDRLMAPSIGDMLRRPVVTLFGPADNTLPVVYAGNVAGAIVLALEAGRGGVTFDVGRDHPLTQAELFQYLARGMGVSPLFVRLPAPVVRAGVRLISAVGIRIPGTEHLPLERVARLALGENPYPSYLIREELAWNPIHHHSEALIRTGRWLAAQAM